MHKLFFEKISVLNGCRPIGSDISIGQRLLEEKCQLGPFEIALLRSVGCEKVSVYK